jgi:hypothetical protein
MRLLCDVCRDKCPATPKREAVICGETPFKFVQRQPSPKPYQSRQHSRIREDAMDDVSFEDYERLAKSHEELSTSHEELSAQVIALTAVVGAMATTSSIDFERLEECVHFAANKLRPGRRPLLFAKAALVLQDFEVMQKALRIETRKRRNLRKAASKR